MEHSGRTLSLLRIARPRAQRPRKGGFVGLGFRSVLGGLWWVVISGIYEDIQGCIVFRVLALFV